MGLQMNQSVLLVMRCAWLFEYGLSVTLKLQFSIPFKNLRLLERNLATQLARETGRICYARDLIDFCALAFRSKD